MGTALSYLYSVPEQATMDKQVETIQDSKQDSNEINSDCDKQENAAKSPDEQSTVSNQQSNDSNQESDASNQQPNESNQQSHASNDDSNKQN